MSTDLTVIEQKDVAFYGDELTAILVKTEESEPAVYVPVRPICDMLGVGKRLRLKNEST